MLYVCDRGRHLVCVPYSVDALHVMAATLGVKRCWFHRDHYDIPKRRIEEITARCRVVSSRDIVAIIRTGQLPTHLQTMPYNWIPTYTGVAFDVIDPKAQDVDPRDIAHGLSQVCRFGGQTRWFYSVAEHSVQVAMNVVCPDLTTDPVGHWRRRLLALLHDASEAYIGDVTTPLKAHLPGYKEIEARIQAAVLQLYDLKETDADHLAVKIADVRMLETERFQVASDTGEEWTVRLPNGRHADPFPATQIACWTPPEAERLFLYWLSFYDGHYRQALAAL